MCNVNLVLITSTEEECYMTGSSPLKVCLPVSWLNYSARSEQDPLQLAN